jgi:hypothetical protein
MPVGALSMGPHGNDAAASRELIVKQGDVIRLATLDEP